MFASLAPAVSPLPDQVPAIVLDRQAMQTPDRVQLGGWVGQRIHHNEAHRLVQLDPERLLEGYRTRPGRQAWEGEHVGKWLHAATLAWANTGDPALRERLSFISSELQKCQLEDGYLGTYLPEMRWKSWDVWAHKYNLIGLITYMRLTGDVGPMDTCRRMADLLCRTFGDAPGQKDLLSAGFHAGMASLSVLEPMVLLYRLTGEQRYLDFCHYILRASEQPDGPKMVSVLLTSGRVPEVGNAKAYEMLSCLNGLLEMYRTTGDSQLLEACQRGWQDIRDHRLYPTGASSYRELFRGDHDLPNVSNVGETCVTVTWLQFNAHLLRLTGEARFAQELERVVLNQLLGAQQPDGTAWGYYVQMQGRKPYSASLTGHCCLSSGPRGVALIPTFAVSTDADGIVVNLYEQGRANLALANGTNVTLTTHTTYPAEGRVEMTVAPASPATFALKLRIPPWSANATLHVNREPVPLRVGADGYARISRPWQAGDRVELNLVLAPRLERGEHANAGKAAFWYGPLVLAADDALLADHVNNLAQVLLPSDELSALDFTVAAAPDAVKSWPGAQVFWINAVHRRTVGTQRTLASVRLGLVPFAEAGGSGSRYQVWLPLVGTMGRNVLVEGRASTSLDAPPATAAGRRRGSAFNDDEDQSIETLVARSAGTTEWFAVHLREAVTINRVTFLHGLSLRDGGWFDTSESKPVVEVQRTADGPWIPAGVLADYPATTATDGRALQQEQSYALETTVAEVKAVNQRQTFALRLPQPETVVGIRVAGRPAQSIHPNRWVLTCAELQAFLD
jgi:uncharacterized protein